MVTLRDFQSGEPVAIPMKTEIHSKQSSTHSPKPVMTVVYHSVDDRIFSLESVPHAKEFSKLDSKTEVLHCIKIQLNKLYNKFIMI